MRPFLLQIVSAALCAVAASEDVQLTEFRVSFPDGRSALADRHQWVRRRDIGGEKLKSRGSRSDDGSGSGSDDGSGSGSDHEEDTLPCFANRFQGPISGYTTHQKIRTVKKIADAQACADECEAESECFSFAYAAGNLRCKLSKSTERDLSKLPIKNTFDYYVYHEDCVTT